MADNTPFEVDLEFDTEDFLPLHGSDRDNFVDSPRRRGASPIDFLQDVSVILQISDNANVLLAITIGPAARVYRVESTVLTKFTKWWSSQLPNRGIYALELGKVAATFLPVVPPFLLLDALVLLLKVLHFPNEIGRKGMTPQHIFALSLVAREILGLQEEHIKWFEACMSVFVDEMDHNDRAISVPGVVWEQALITCHRFEWVELWTRLAAQLALYCLPNFFSNKFPEKLGLPNGDTVEGEAISIIVNCQLEVFTLFYGWGSKSLNKWITELETRPPCGSQACTMNRLGALKAFAKVAGMQQGQPQTPDTWKNSMFEIIAGLQIIHGDQKRLPKPLLWAEKIKKRFSGVCYECPDKTPSSYLFPLEDVFTELTWCLHKTLLDHTRYPFPFGPSELNGKGRIKVSAKKEKSDKTFG
ncbi:hypothetical protein QBC38DRAFT_528355 [Podospora fimiseda]|uniref:Uncharacterized protein n=1 Tax=Podospora fimiseda TaxID=252190 RepID=A0AAN7GXS3_9PEZI|nr:hypothetical protein QBC38DRAFT_528355 [Podospora fimiseda]